MKIYLFPVVLGGFVITIILQAVLFASTGLQNQHLQKQLNDVTQRLDKLQSLTADNIATLVFKKLMTDTPTDPAKSEVNLVQSDPNDLLSPENLSKILGEATGAANLKP